MKQPRSTCAKNVTWRGSSSKMNVRASQTAAQAAFPSRSVSQITAGGLKPIGPASQPRGRASLPAVRISIPAGHGTKTRGRSDAAMCCPLGEIVSSMAALRRFLAMPAQPGAMNAGPLPAAGCPRAFTVCGEGVMLSLRSANVSNSQKALAMSKRVLPKDSRGIGPSTALPRLARHAQMRHTIRASSVVFASDEYHATHLLAYILVFSTRSNR